MMIMRTFMIRACVFRDDCDAILTIMPKDSARSQGTETGLKEGELLGKPMLTILSLHVKCALAIMAGAFF